MSIVHCTLCCMKYKLDIYRIHMSTIHYLYFCGLILPMYIYVHHLINNELCTVCNDMSIIV